MTEEAPPPPRRPASPVPVVRELTLTLAYLGGLATLAAVGLAAAVGTDLLALGGILASGVAFTVAGTGVVHTWVRGVDAELRRLGVGVRRMGTDPARARLRMRRRDEIGALARALDQLRSRFRAALDRERQARREVEDTNATKDAFLMAVRHELRTPLNAILGFADVLLSEIDGELTESQREDARIILSSGRHLQSLFDDVIELSAAVSHQLDLDVETTDLVPILHDVVSEQRPQARRKNLRIRLRAPDRAPLVGDPKRLRQVFTNLVANAVKFTETGHVEVVVRVSDTTLTVEVRDTGMGIPESAQETIFDEFLQAPGRFGKGRRQVGAGLGLAIVRRLVELHEGRIMLWSEEGQGSIFTVRLPVSGPIGADLREDA
ncbi:MAG: hypothetical protein CMN30_08500 [Sandaracinus sp.]|nr:hypothetical protein [Sandaracinus sp.]